MSSGGAQMNAAALPVLRVMPGTGHFGWDWLSGGKRWKVKVFGNLPYLPPLAAEGRVGG